MRLSGCAGRVVEVGWGDDGVAWREVVGGVGLDAARLGGDEVEDALCGASACFAGLERAGDIAEVLQGGHDPELGRERVACGGEVSERGEDSAAARRGEGLAEIDEGDFGLVHDAIDEGFGVDEGVEDVIGDRGVAVGHGRVSWWAGEKTRPPVIA